MKIFKKIDGFKSYIVAGLGIVSQLAVSSGDDILVNLPELFNSIYPFLLIMTGRSALKKIELKK